MKYLTPFFILMLLQQTAVAQCTAPTITAGGPIAFCAGGSVTLSVPQANNWTKKTDFGGAARQWGVAFSIGNKGYVGTGYDVNNDYTKDFWEYNPATNFWTQKADFGGSARINAVGFGIGSKGYIGTGYTGVAVKDFWEYDPAPVYVLSDRVPEPVITAGGPTTFCEGNVALSAPTSPVWNPKAQCYDFRSMATGFSIGDRGYIVGGLKSSNGFKYETSDVFEYNPAGNGWTRKEFFPIKRIRAVGFSIGNKGYIGTGTTDNQVVKDFWEYNPANDTWTQKADFGGVARQDAAGFGIGSKGYIGTGSDASGTRVKDFWEYDPATNAWTKKADVGGAGRSGAVGFNIGGMGYIGTGSTSNGLVKDFWQYNPATNTWAQKADFSGPARGGATGFAIGKKGYIGTGNDGANYLKDFWRYDPATNLWLQRKDLPGEGRDYAVGFAIGNQGYVSTGRINTNIYLRDLWELNGNDDYTYAWNPGNLTTSSITATTSGSYTVALTSIQGCSATSNPVVVAAGTPTAKPAVTTSVPTTICQGGSVTLSAPEGFASYLWSPGGQTSSSINVTDSGSYTVSVASAGACVSAPSDTITVRLKALPAKPVVAAGGPTSFCAGGSVTLSTPGGLSAYQWNPGGQTTPSITATQSGSYTVTVTGENDCSAISDAIVVEAETAPKPAIAASGPTKFCAGGSVTLSVPTGYASYKWSPGGQTLASVNVTQSGTYSVTVTTALGCIAISDSVVIEPETVPTPMVISSGPTTFCAGGDVTLSASAAGDTWTHKADFIAGIDDEVVIFSIGNKGYIGTGSGTGAGGGWGNKDFWEYDPLTNVWTQKADFGNQGRLDAAGFSIGNKGYIGTGWPVPGDYAKDFWEYDPAANVWTRKADFGGVGRKYATGFSVGSKGYLGLGYSRDEPLRDFWEYNPLTNNWTQIADFGGDGREQPVAFSIGNKGYVGTGLSYYFEQFSDFWEYDPATNAWTRKADYGGGRRYNAGGFSIGTKGYIGAGYGEDYPSLTNDFWEYNPTTDAWTRKADITGAENYMAIAFSTGGKGYFFYQNEATDNFWEYDPGFNYTWQPGGQTGDSLTVSAPGSYSLIATRATGSGCSATSNPVVVSLTPPTGLALNGYKDTVNVTNSAVTTLAANCLYIGQLTPNGTSPVADTVIATIWVEASEPADDGATYIRRHAEITPVTNAATATARVTLYMLQSEFNNFNNVSSVGLPTGPGDAAGISRLRVYKYNGTSSDGTGQPATYPGTSTIIDPEDADITWNSPGQYWQISFDVTGFSGFFIGAAEAVLPLKLTVFTARKQGSTSLLSWQVAQEDNIANYTIERSADGRGYTTKGSVVSSGNTTTSRNYSFPDANPLKGANYYRLRITEKDGKVNYSEVRVLNWGNTFTIALYPNPAKDKATLIGVEAGMQIRLLDVAGKVLRVQKATSTTESVALSGLAQGLYIVQVHGTDGQLLSTARMVKE